MPAFPHSLLGRTGAAICRFLPAAALVCAALLLSPPPAAAQQNHCRPPAGSRVSVTGYDFTFRSHSIGSGNARNAHNCVQNHNTGRGVRIDWKGAQLNTAVAPGGHVAINRPLGRMPTGQQHPLYYGTSGIRIDAHTIVNAEPPAGVAAGHPLFRRAAYQDWSDSSDRPVTEPGLMPVGRNSARVYLPAGGPALVQFAATNPSQPALTEWLETSARLQPFSMTFDSNARPAGASIAITYEVRYRLPAFAASGAPSFYFRFTDPALQQQLYGRSGPVPVNGSDGGETVLRANFNIPRAAIAGRTARLEVLLGNGRLLAALPVTYSAAR